MSCRTKTFAQCAILLTLVCSACVREPAILRAVDLHSSLEVIKSLEEGAAIDVIGGEFGETALMRAARIGDIDLVRLLIRKGAAINAKGKRGDTALMAAAMNCRGEIISILLENGADPKIRNHTFQSSALHLAIQFCKTTETIQELLNHGAEKSARNASGETPLVVAVRRGKWPFVHLLINRGADLDVRNADGFTALHLAVTNRDVEGVKMLISSRADVNRPALIADTLINRFKIARSEVRRNYLSWSNPWNKQVDFDLNHRGMTALMLASQRGYAEIARLLLGAKADTAILDVEGKTAADFAYENGFLELAELIKNTN